MVSHVDPLIRRSAYRDRPGEGEHKNRFRVCNFGPGKPGLRLYNMRTCLAVGSIVVDIMHVYRRGGSMWVRERVGLLTGSFIKGLDYVNY